MNYRSFSLIASVLSLGGVLFAGYLSYRSLFSSSCAFNERCPYLLGWPVCVFGLAFYAGLLCLSLLGLIEAHHRRAAQGIALLSVGGILFSGIYTIIELTTPCPGGCHFALILPSCAYGLVMFIILAALSWLHLRR